MTTYASISRLNGKKNAAGFASYIYAAPISEFDAIAGLKTTTGAGDSVTIDGAHTFTTTSGFSKWNCTIATAGLSSEIAGDEDSHIYKMKGEIFVPGLDKTTVEALILAMYDDWIFIFEDINDPTVRIQVGSEALPAKIKPKMEGGKVGTGKKGFSCEIEAWTSSIAFYEGSVAMNTRV